MMSFKHYISLHYQMLLPNLLFFLSNQPYPNFPIQSTTLIHQTLFTLINLTFSRSCLQGNLEYLYSPKKYFLYGPPSMERKSQSGMTKNPQMDFYMTVQLVSGDGKLLCAPINTDFGKSETNHQYHWDKVIEFPMKHQALPLDTHISFTLWDIIDPKRKVPCGGTSIPLFNSKGILREGKQKLHVWESLQGDPIKTPGKVHYSNKMDKIEKVCKEGRGEKKFSTG